MTLLLTATNLSFSFILKLFYVNGPVTTYFTPVAPKEGLFVLQTEISGNFLLHIFFTLYIQFFCFLPSASLLLLP